MIRVFDKRYPEGGNANKVVVAVMTYNDAIAHEFNTPQEVLRHIDTLITASLKSWPTGGEGEVVPIEIRDYPGTDLYPLGNE